MRSARDERHRSAARASLAGKTPRLVGINAECEEIDVEQRLSPIPDGRLIQAWVDDALTKIPSGAARRMPRGVGQWSVVR
jgi:hypothetical protein